MGCDRRCSSWRCLPLARGHLGHGGPRSRRPDWNGELKILRLGRTASRIRHPRRRLTWAQADGRCGLVPAARWPSRQECAPDRSARPPLSVHVHGDPRVGEGAWSVASIPLSCRDQTSGRTRLRTAVRRSSQKPGGSVCLHRAAARVRPRGAGRGCRVVARGRSRLLRHARLGEGCLSREPACSVRPDAM